MPRGFQKNHLWKRVLNFDSHVLPWLSTKSIGECIPAQYQCGRNSGSTDICGLYHKEYIGASFKFNVHLEHTMKACITNLFSTDFVRLSQINDYIMLFRVEINSLGEGMGLILWLKQLITKVFSTVTLPTGDRFLLFHWFKVFLTFVLVSLVNNNKIISLW